MTQVGFETICKATDCIYNDRPICKIHTLRRPITIGRGGKCISYQSKTVSVIKKSMKGGKCDGEYLQAGKNLLGQVLSGR